MIYFKKLRWRNFLSTGNQFIEVDLAKSPSTLIIGSNGSGKSTLFNALTQSNIAEAANYPFATIEPNIGRVPVPDKRLDNLASISNSLFLR